MAQATADTVAINLVAGLISAQEIKAVTTTTIDSSGVLHVSSTGSSFNNLVILGHVYNGSVPANTRITLPLLGYVVLNEQTSNVGTNSASLAINMIHVHVTGFNLLGLQIGTEIIVSNAVSGIINVFAPAIITGGSFATQVTGNPLTSAQTAPVALPCLGTGGVVLNTKPPAPSSRSRRLSRPPRSPRSSRAATAAAVRPGGRRGGPGHRPRPGGGRAGELVQPAGLRSPERAAVGGRDRAAHRPRPAMRTSPHSSRSSCTRRCGPRRPRWRGGRDQPAVAARRPRARAVRRRLHSSIANGSPSAATRAST